MSAGISGERIQARIMGSEKSIERLAGFLGPVAVLTNPMRYMETHRFKNPAIRERLARAVAGIFKTDLPVGLSFHASRERYAAGIQEGFDRATEVIQQGMAERGIVLRRHSRPDGASGVYVTPNPQMALDSFAEALRDTQGGSSDLEVLRAKGHLAMISAMGADSIGLDYDIARGGNVFELVEAEADGKVVWEQVFNITSELFGSRVQ